MIKMHKILISKLKGRADKADICALAEVSEMLIDKIKEVDTKLYECAEDILYEAYYGKKLTKELAEKLIHKMKPHGMKWTLEQTNEVMKNYGLGLNEIDFWYVMNMAYNDYSEMFGDNVDEYVKFSKLFIEDVDGGEDKVYLYATKI